MIYSRFSKNLLLISSLATNDTTVGYPVVIGSDELSATLNYAELIDVVKKVMAEPSALLDIFTIL